MPKIPLTQGKVAIVDEDDYYPLTKHKWHAVKTKSGFYAARSVRTDQGHQIKQFMHRVIMGIDGGPRSEYVDHVDGNGLNNRRLNLRHATNSQNQGNTRKTRGASRYRGVIKGYKGKWRAHIYENGRHRFIGNNYPNEEEAALDYDKAARAHWGRFAKCNFDLAQERKAKVDE